jgi:CHAT domain-containing protein
MTDEALEFLGRALSIRTRIGVRDQEAGTLHALAGVDLQSGRRDSALTRIQQAVHIVEALRAKALSPALRSSYYAIRQQYFELLIRVLMELGKAGNADSYIEQAFLATERSRSRVLLELLTEPSDETSLPDSSFPQLNRTLVRQMNSLEHRLTGLLEQDSMVEYASTANKLRLLRAEWREVEECLLNANPRSRALNSQPASLAEIQNSIVDEDTLLLQYSIGVDGSYVWLVSRNEVASFPLAPRDQIENAAKRAHRFLSTRARRGDFTCLSELSRLLIAPFSESLRGRRLLINVEGCLQYVPFAALNNPGTNLLLGERYEIVYAPSASIVGALRRNRIARPHPNRRKLLLIADPVFGFFDDRAPATAMRPELDEQSPPRLAFSRNEAEAIRNTMQACEISLREGFDATRDFVLSADLAQYQYIHFTTHTHVDRFPELSSIFLSRLTEDGKIQNGQLRLFEIQRLRLGADLVVLATCENALGTQMNGEGLISIARGFFNAGAASVLATLWESEDQSTVKFMSHFYSALSNETDQPSAALKIAQSRLRSDPRWAHPYFWAGFVLLGDWSKINLG